MKLKIIPTIKKIDANSWNKITKGPEFSYEWFSYVEEKFKQTLRPSHLLLYEKKTLVGIIPAFIPCDSKNIFNEVMFGRIKKFTLLIKSKPLLIFSPNTLSSEIFFNKNISKAYLNKVMSKIEEYAKKAGITDIVFLHSAKNNITEKLEDYNKVFINKTAIMDIDFSSFEDYIKQKKRGKKRSIRSDLNRLKKSRSEIIELKDIRPYFKTITRLTSNIQTKFGKQKTDIKHTRLFFKTLKKYATTYALKHHGKIIATQTMLIKDDIIKIASLGLDYKECRKNAAYFHMIIYNPIRVALHLNAKMIRIGPESYQAKASRGARLVSQYMFVKPLKHKTLKRLWYKVLDYQYRRKFRKHYKAHI